MDMNAADGRVAQYFRRRQLGLQLLAYGARSQTVQTWSGLTRDQLVTMRRRWMADAQDRRRGPSPSSFDVFFRSPRARNRAALLGSLLQIVGVVPTHRGPRTARQLPSLEAGERLCEAFELLRIWDPGTDIDFEQAVLLATGITAERVVKLDTCSQCKAAVLLDKLGLNTPACSLCKETMKPR